MADEETGTPSTRTAPGETVPLPSAPKAAPRTTPVVEVAPAPPAQNPNFIIAGVTLAAFLGVVLVGLTLKQGSAGNSEKERLQQELALLQGSSQSGSASALISRIDQDVDQLRGLVTGFDSAQAAMQSELASSRGTRETLTQDLARLRSELAAAQANSQNNEQLSSQLESARALLQSSQTQLQELRAKPDLSQDLLQATQQVDSLRKRVADLESQLEGSVSGDRMDRLRTELGQLRDENSDLKERLRVAERQLARVRLYVEDASSLNAPLNALYRELLALEDAESLDVSYADLKDSLNARMIDTLAFPTGSADLDTPRYGQIAKDVALSNDQANFLVVGYASKSGNSDDNRELSAKRATGVASVISSVLKPDQTVQAVFLGETDRFSSDSEGPNQICEIWEVVPQ